MAKELEPKVGCPAEAAPEPELEGAGVPQGDDFWPICDAAPKALGVGEAAA